MPRSSDSPSAIRPTCHHLAAVRALFWISTALIVWTQALYAPALALLRKAKGSPPTAPRGAGTPERHADHRRLQARRR